MSVVKIAKIQGNLHVPNSSDTIAMLTSVLPDTMQITWKKNSEYQMQFEGLQQRFRRLLNAVTWKHG